MPVTNYLTVNGEILSETRNGVEHDYLPDSLGSTVALLDASGITDTFEYWPYGELRSRTGTTPTPFQFVGTLGYYTDSSSVYVRARYYLANYAGWQTVDPLWPEESAYAYANGNAPTRVDAFGDSPYTVAMSYIGPCRNVPGNKSVASIFRCCQRSAEATYAVREICGWQQTFPGGRRQICELCAFAVNFKIDCSSQPDPKKFKYPGGIVPWEWSGNIGLLNFSFTPCMEDCMNTFRFGRNGALVGKTIGKSLCKRMCHIFAEKDVNGLDDYCGELAAGGHRNMAAMCEIMSSHIKEMWAS